MIPSPTSDAARARPISARRLTLLGLIGGAAAWAAAECVYLPSLLPQRDRFVQLMLEAQKWEQAEAAGRIDAARRDAELLALETQEPDNPFVQTLLDRSISDAEAQRRFADLRTRVWVWNAWWFTTATVGLTATAAAVEAAAARDARRAMESAAVGGACGLIAGPLVSCLIDSLTNLVSEELTPEALLPWAFVRLAGWSLLGACASASRLWVAGSVHGGFRTLTGGALAGAAAWLAFELNLGSPALGRVIWLTAFGAAVGAAAAWSAAPSPDVVGRTAT
ncbi:MAG TPA: hypothetical protein VGE52_03745 [Pirellulales bacterium]